MSQAAGRNVVLIFEKINKKYSYDGLPTTIEAHVTTHTRMEGIYDPTAGTLSAYYSDEMFQHDITLIEAGDVGGVYDVCDTRVKSYQGTASMEALAGSDDDTFMFENVASEQDMACACGIVLVEGAPSAIVTEQDTSAIVTEPDTSDFEDDIVSSDGTEQGTFSDSEVINASEEDPWQCILAYTPPSQVVQDAVAPPVLNRRGMPMRRAAMRVESRVAGIIQWENATDSSSLVREVAQQIDVDFVNERTCKRMRVTQQESDSEDSDGCDDSCDGGSEADPDEPDIDFKHVEVDNDDENCSSSTECTSSDEGGSGDDDEAF